ncbi:MAG: hypothetical protein J6V80_04425 [Clostridia bacterium]|nr:hypothetical protein [Clostridia bacterium]
MSLDYKSALEIERKYIIEMPDITVLSAQEEYTKSEITQIYLSSEKGETHRIRRRVFSDRVELTETRKIRIDEMSVTEIEGQISNSYFEELAENIEQGTAPISKTRHTFIFRDQTFEIDVYPAWSNTAIMETELKNRDEMVQMPPFIRIIKEVTGNKKYSNAAMSKSFPDEIK